MKQPIQIQEYESDDELVVELDRPVLVDLEGNDALSQSHDEIRYQVQRYSNAALPAVLERLLKIALKSKSDKDAMEAMKMIKAFSEGDFKEKAIEGQAKKLTDAEILKKLEVINQ